MKTKPRDKYINMNQAQGNAFPHRGPPNITITGSTMHGWGNWTGVGQGGNEHLLLNSPCYACRSLDFHIYLELRRFLSSRFVAKGVVCMGRLISEWILSNIERHIGSWETDERERKRESERLLVWLLHSSPSQCWRTATDVCNDGWFMCGIEDLQCEAPYPIATTKQVFWSPFRYNIFLGKRFLLA